MPRFWKVWGKWHFNFGLGKFGENDILGQGLGKCGGNGKWHFNFSRGLGKFGGNGIFILARVLELEHSGIMVFLRIS